MMSKWCRIVEIDGKQVLFQNKYNPDDDEYQLKMTIQTCDWINNSPIADASLNIGRADSPFTGNAFDNFASEKTARAILEKDILPLLRKIA